jgi:hypothetical protein
VERAELIAVEITEVGAVERLGTLRPSDAGLALVLPTELQRLRIEGIDVAREPPAKATIMPLPTVAALPSKGLITQTDGCSKLGPMIVAPDSKRISSFAPMTPSSAR